MPVRPLSCVLLSLLLLFPGDGQQSKLSANAFRLNDSWLALSPLEPTPAPFEHYFSFTFMSPCSILLYEQASNSNRS